MYQYKPISNGTYINNDFGCLLSWLLAELHPCLTFFLRDQRGSISFHLSCAVSKFHSSKETHGAPSAHHSAPGEALMRNVNQECYFKATYFSSG